MCRERRKKDRERERERPRGFRIARMRTGEKEDSYSLPWCTFGASPWTNSVRRHSTRRSSGGGSGVPSARTESEVHSVALADSALR